jgi:hypothetical protein
MGYVLVFAGAQTIKRSSVVEGPMPNGLYLDTHPRTKSSPSTGIKEGHGPQLQCHSCSPRHECIV